MSGRTAITINFPRICGFSTWASREGLGIVFDDVATGKTTFSAIVQIDDSAGGEVFDTVKERVGHGVEVENESAGIVPVASRERSAPF